MKDTTMKTRLITVLMTGLLAGSVRAQDKPEFKDDTAKFSYAVGLNTGNQLKRKKIAPDTELILKGIKDGLAGHAQLTDQELNEVFRAFPQEHRKQMAAKNKQEGDTFLAENRNKEGVKTLDLTLADGKKAELQYKVL